MMIRGQFANAQFCHWIAHRARLLSLSGWVMAHDKGALEVCVSGNQILVDAMETACSLGPLDAQVESIEMQQQEYADSGDGFTIRSAQ